MAQPYNVFISWSGERSRAVAQKLKEWLPCVVQAARPWMSDADIEKGSRGLAEVTKALAEMKVGIICLSPDNLEVPWLLFESGALSKAIDNTSRVCTYLLDGLAPEDVKPPLGMFQATRATKEDSRKLVQTINLSVSAEPVRQEDLDSVFDAMWPQLESTLKDLPRFESAKAVRRNPDDMIAEILEIVRAEANRRQFEPARPQFPGDPEGSVVGAIMEEAMRQQKFLGELVQQASRWVISGDDVRIYFPAERRALAEMLSSKEQLKALRAIASGVLGMPVKLTISVDPKREA